MLNLTYYKNKTIAVFGLGISGIAITKALVNSGARVYAWDDNEVSRQKLQDALVATDSLHILDYHQYNWQDIDYLVLAPGVPFAHAKKHAIVKLADENNIEVTCDIELLSVAHADKNIIGITGTNGKSTTTALANHVLQANNIDVAMGGNIGIPVGDLPDAENYLLELSSYQLHLMHEAQINIAVLLNITPDHIDSHGSLAEYIQAKQKIFKMQGQGDVAIFSVDGDVLKDNPLPLGEGRVRSKTNNQKLIPISIKQKLEYGISFIDDIVYIKLVKPSPYPLPREKVINIDTAINLSNLVNLRGQHNKENIIAVFAICCALGIKPEKIKSAILTFKGLPHRLELIRQYQHISFVNDSKATNAESTIQAIKAYSGYKIYWILGGVAKAEGIKPLRELFGNIEQAFVIGKDKSAFTTELSQANVAYHEYNDLALAVSDAVKQAQSHADKSVILFSPAAASFDMWQNFEKRGAEFCDISSQFLFREKYL